MAESKGEYPIATLHTFLQEASEEFKRYRVQAKLNVIAGVFLLFFLTRIIDLLYETASFRSAMRVPMLIDATLLALAFVAVATSLNVWRHQRKFIARWGQRFEKLQLLESQLLPEDRA